VNRRQFLASSAASAVVVGCARPPAAPGAKSVSASEARVIPVQRKAREEHLRMLEGFRVPATAKRTTPPRPVEMAKLFPDLDLRTRLRATSRLHPRFGDEPAPGETKIGGRFWWPTSEPWPTCETFGVPLVPVLQVRMEDTPPSVKFKPGTDLLQVLWSPRDHGEHGPKPRLYWRKAADVKEPLAEYPSTEFALMDSVPVACRAFPEQVTEFPDWATIRVTPLGDQIRAWKPPAGGDPVDLYQKQLSAAPGTKVGGFPFWKGEAKPPACGTCRRGMDYLLTIDSDEWGNASWVPTEEAGKPATPGLSKAPGLTLPAPGNRHAFVCRRCPDWPASWVG